jgi:hypothetical protein
MRASYRSRALASAGAWFFGGVRFAVMRRLAIVLVLMAACSGSTKKAPAGAGSGSGSGSGPALYGKKLTLGWGIQAGSGHADVFLETTDETGKQVSYPLGTYPGECKVITPIPDMKAVSGVACTSGATGTELDAVVSSDEIIVLRLRTDAGVTPDPMSREEVTRVKAPPGAKVEAGT